MELSSRLFGFSSFSMVLPQALEGVAAVALLYAAVGRWFGQSAALLSGLILAVTPVVALMFRSTIRRRCWSCCSCSRLMVSRGRASEAKRGG